MARREGVAGAPPLTDAPTGCSNAVCGLVEASEAAAAGKKGQRLTVNVGEEVRLTVVSTFAIGACACVCVRVRVRVYVCMCVRALPVAEPAGAGRLAVWMCACVAHLLCGYVAQMSARASWWP